MCLTPCSHSGARSKSPSPVRRRCSHSPERRTQVSDFDTQSGSINDKAGNPGHKQDDLESPSLKATDMGTVAKARLMNSKLRSQAMEDRLNMAASANHRSRELSPYNPQPGKSAQ